MKKKTYTQVALETGLSISHISRVMRGEKAPSMEALIKIAWALDMKVEKLLKILSTDREREML